MGGEDEQPRRRSTFTPPPPDSPFPERLGELSDEEIQRAREVTERASHMIADAASSPAGGAEFTPPPLVVPAHPVVPPAPRRQSLSDQDIIARFSQTGSADTSALIDQLEQQLVLRQQEDAAFQTWSQNVSALLGADEARRLIEREQRAFEGLPPLPEPEPAREPEPVSHPETVSAQGVVAGESDDAGERAVVSPADWQESSSEPIVLPTWGSDPAAPAEGVPDSAGDTSDFDQVLVDPDAVTPPTRAWPLIDEQVAEQASDSLLVREVADVEGDVPSGDAPHAELSAGVEELLPQAPSLVEGGVVVGTETLSVEESKPVVPLPEPDESDEALLLGEKWFSFDRVGEQPSPLTQRTHRSLRLFWTWWGASVPIVSVFLGFWLVGSGLNLLQASIATGVGLVIATVPLALGTLLGVRTGLPTLVSSRLAFGLWGNLIPTAVMLILRLIVSSAMLWLTVWALSGIVQEANFWRGDPLITQAVIAGVAVLIVGALVIAGRRFVSLMLLVSAGLGTVAVALFVVLTWDSVSREALVQPLAGPAPLAAGITLVASVFMVVWAQSGGDIARFQVPGTGAAGTSAVSLAALLPPFAVIVWGSLLAASGSEVRQAFALDPFDAVLEGIPGWYPAPSLLLVGLPLLAVTALTLHSSTFAVLSTGMSLPRYAAATVVTVLVTLLTLAVIVLDLDVIGQAVDTLAFVGVVVAAWSGALLGEVLTRRKSPDPAQLLGRGRSFPGWRIAPLVGVGVAIALGWGMNESGLSWLAWQGYLTPLLEAAGLVDLGPWQLGLVVSLVFSLAVTAFAGIRGGVVTQAPQGKE